MIAGSGIPIDAVVSAFVSGAAEVLSPDNDDDHWDVIEGQGSLFHPGYAAGEPRAAARLAAGRDRRLSRRGAHRDVDPLVDGMGPILERIRVMNRTA